MSRNYLKSLHVGRLLLLSLLALVIFCSSEPDARDHSYRVHAMNNVSQEQMPACGLVDDEKARVPTTWTTFTPPVRGASYVDPMFGCTVTRLTDAVRDGVAEHHYYATLTPMSADDSKILVNDEHGNWMVVDEAGDIIVPVSQMPARNEGTLLWDAADGNTFYFTRGNSILKGRIAGHEVTVSTVHSFSEYQIVVFPDKTDLSIDGQSFAMWAGHTAESGALDIFTYNMQSNAKKRPYTTMCSQIVAYIQGPCVHGITQTADDNVIIDFSHDGSCQECGNRLWEGRTLSKVQDGTNHLDTGYDLRGHSIFIELGGRLTLPGEKNPCPSGWGLDVRELIDLTSATCLVDRQPSSHISYRGNPSQPWVALSFFDERKKGPELFNHDPGFAPPSYGNWGLYEDEIMLARIDGGARYRLADARSRSAEYYWAQPHAAITRDGKYVIFDSNMAYAQSGCPTGMEDCSDVYLIKVR